MNFFKDIKPRDVIAVIVLLVSFLLVYLNNNNEVMAGIATIIGYYFGIKKNTNNNI